MSLNYFVHLACLFPLFRQINLGERARRLSSSLWGKKGKKPFFFTSVNIFFKIYHILPRGSEYCSWFSLFQWKMDRREQLLLKHFQFVQNWSFFFLLWIKCLDENCLSGERERALQGWGASLLHEWIWQHWMVQMICLPYPAAQWAGGEKMNRKKCYFIQCELKNKESVNWSGNKELGIRRKLQRNQGVKKPHVNFSSTANQGTKLECWVPADLSPLAPNEKSTWPCFGTFTADVKAWNSTRGWRSDKASWLQYLWGWRAGCTGREEQLAFFISPMAGRSGRLWKSIQMPPSIKRDKARPLGEVNTESFICLCFLLVSLLLLQCRSPSLQAEQSAASLGESWGSWNIDTSQAGS